MSNLLQSRRVVALVATLSAAVLALSACSSTGGKPRTTDGGMGAGTADTPRATIAMITHGVPGNAFWDLVRKGAETAAAKDNSNCDTRPIPRRRTRPISSKRRSTARWTASR